MSRVTHTAPGLAALRNRLADLPRVAERATGQALDQVAERAAEAIRAAFPSAPASAITVSADPNGTGYTLTVDVPFAFALEFGTSQRPAQTFLRPIAMAAAADAPSLFMASVPSALKGDAL